MGLQRYKAKRHFDRTSEPAGRVHAGSNNDFFVIQKHAASRLHFDFRLAMEGVLKSWAVPKGMPLRKGEKHLAVQVEDHPVEYADFEGVIAPGNYGAGTVMVWDRGNYSVKGGDPSARLHEGKLHITLHGKKLKGDWTLVRMKPRPGEDKEQWLIFKSGEETSLSLQLENKSVLSRRTMEEIAEARDAEWESHRAASKTGSPFRARIADLARRMKPKQAGRKTQHDNDGVGAASSTKCLRDAAAPGNLQKRTPGFVEPMKALLVNALPKGSEWTYEIKFDGYRALAVKRGGSVTLFSRNEKDITRNYSALAEALRDLLVKEAVLDGEIVALDEKGRSSFQLLQRAGQPNRAAPRLFYYVFDLLNLDGKDLTGLPLCDRKDAAERLVSGLPDAIRYSSGIRANEEVVAEMKRRGLEGLIAKKRDSKYEIGRRSGAWVKFKWTHEQEFIIGGYTQPKGTRQHFGAVLVGYYDKGKLIFASKVGTGFDTKLLESLHAKFQKLVRKGPPFVNVPTRRASGSQNLSHAEMRRCTWLEPKLVCQIRFSEWTSDGGLRQPVFLGLREDKKPREVVRETPQ